MNIKKIKILPQFKKLFDKIRYKILIGGRGSGKSESIARAIVILTSNYKCNVLCLREFQNSIADSSYALIVAIIDSHGLRDQFNITDTEISHKGTGSWIKFKGLARNIESIKSFADTDIAWIEEGETISKKSWSILVPTIRKQGSEIWVSLNNRLPTDVIPEMFIENEPPKNSWVSHSTYLDNPLLSQTLKDEAEDCKKRDPLEYAHIWLGQYRTQTEKQVVGLGLAREAVNRIVDKPHGFKIAGLDVAFDGGDKTVLAVREDAKLTDLEMTKDLDPVQVGMWAGDLCVSLGVNVLVIDANGLGAGAVGLIKSRFKGNVISFFGQSPSSDPRYSNKKTMTWFAMRDWLRTGSIPDDPELINDLIIQEYEFTAKEKIGLVSKKKMTKSPDCGDALSMTFDPDIKNETVKFNADAFVFDFA